MDEKQLEVREGEEEEKTPPPRAPSARKFRTFVQLGFLVGAALVGLQFHFFTQNLSSPETMLLVERPPAVEAWLPISSFMSLVYLAKTGIANRVHPAGFVLFTLILVLSFSLGRAFCSWVCPVGALNEYGHKIGRKIFGRNPRLPNWLDLILRSAKYVILGYFVYFIIFKMPLADLEGFIHMPYNQTADLKMYYLFLHLSTTSVIVILVLSALSLVFKNFLCRYLCPYGALLGLCALIKPLSVRRDSEPCTDCGLCSKACSNRIPVRSKTSVRSVECTTCYDCVSACPHGALAMRWGRSRKRLSAIACGLLLIGAFIFVPQAARALGYWKAETSLMIYYRMNKALKQDAGGPGHAPPMGGRR